MAKRKSLTSEEQYLYMGEIVKISGIKDSTFRHYSNIGLLPFTRKNENDKKKYNKLETLKRLKQIEQLRKKFLPLSEIKKRIL